MCGCDQAVAGVHTSNQQWARNLHDQMLITQTALARVPREPTGGRWMTPKLLNDWRTVRSQWAAWYGRGQWYAPSAGDTLNAYQNVLNGWRRYFGLNALPTLAGPAISGADALTIMGADDMAQPTRLSGRMDENQWFVASGFDPSVDVRIVFQARGRHVHAWARVAMPGGPPFFVHATTSVEDIERELAAHPKIRAQMTAAGGEASVGWFGSKVFKKIKSAAKKIGVTKVITNVRNLAKKAINNPLIRTAMMATPYGQLALAVNKGASIASAALRGNIGAKNAIGHLVKQWQAGNPQAAVALRFIRAGARTIRGVAPAVSAGDDASAFRALGQLYRPGPDMTALGDDVDALLTFASAGAFEGTRWLLDRMSLRSMANHPAEFGTRDALMSGRNVLATRFA